MTTRTWTSDRGKCGVECQEGGQENNSQQMQTATTSDLVYVQLCLMCVCTKLGDSDVLSDRGGLAMFTLCVFMDCCYGLASSGSKSYMVGAQTFSVG